MSQDRNTDLLELSKRRWRGQEPDAGLTWGKIMIGDPFVDFLLSHAAPNETSRLAEVGPGYGRVLRTLIQRNIPFARYVGLELSAARAADLTQRFQDPRVTFLEADVLDSIELDPVDVSFGSAVFEHFYPDFGTALRTISGFMRTGGALVFDLIHHDDALQSAAAWFDEVTYMRIYSRAELETLLSENGFRFDAVGKISFGKDVIDREIVRTAVCSTKV
jgi:SAM-dependent methyltransferase